MKKEETINENFEKVIKDCNEIKDEVKAFIVLAVTDKETKEGHKKGVHAVEGNLLYLMNLIANIKDGLVESAVLLKKLSKDN